MQTTRASARSHHSHIHGNGNGAAANFASGSLAAIWQSVVLGKVLQTSNPEMLTMYVEDGMSYGQIAKSLKVEEKHHVTERIATNAVSNALHGHPGNGTKGYDGLGSPEALKKAAKTHNVNNAKKIGKLMRDSKKGIHALSFQEKSRIGERAGAVSYLRRVGIHSMSHEQKKASGRNAALSRGQVPWVQASAGQEAETDFIWRVAHLQENQYQSGGNKGRPMAEKIRLATNREYHGGKNVRSKHMIQQALTLRRKSEQAQNAY